MPSQRARSNGADSVSVVQGPDLPRSPYAVVGGPPTALLLRIEDAAARLGCSARGVYELIEQGRLPATRLPLSLGARGHLRVKAKDLEQLVASLPTVGE